MNTNAKMRSGSMRTNFHIWRKIPFYGKSVLFPILASLVYLFNKSTRWILTNTTMRDTTVFYSLLLEVERQLHQETLNPERDEQRFIVLVAYAQELRQIHQHCSRTVVVNEKK